MNSALALLVVAILHLCVAVDATEFIPFVKFNGGVVDSTRSCSPAEWTNVVAKLYRAFGTTQRRLGGTRKEGTRDLAMCGGLLSYTPRCAGRTGGNRLLLDNTTPCATATTKMNTVFDGLMPNMSASCKAYLGSSREYTCREPIVCDITAIALWNANSDTLVTPVLNATGTKICASFKANFEAKSNFYLGDVNYILKGPNNFLFTQREFETPYFAFGNIGSDIFSKHLAAGVYTLTAVSALAPTKGKTVQFEVTANCP